MRWGIPLHIENWLALFHVAGVGPKTFLKYLKQDETLSSLPENIKPDWKAVEQDLTWAQAHDNHIVLLSSSDYPEILKKISTPPPVLFVKGDLKLLNKPQIAMVGSRNPSSQGIENAKQFAQYFAELGFVVTSGLALGIDKASHMGALQVSHGETIAVLGSGLENIYPSSHQGLAQTITQQGALVSEFSLKAQPIAGNFPRRNRVISGLTLGVLVVEAALKSGSLITAETAMEQGREVFAIPGSIHSPKIKGCHHLIRQGAKLVESGQDVLEELGALLKFVTHGKKKNLGVTQAMPKLKLDHICQLVLEQVDYESTPVDLVVERCHLPVQKVVSILTQLALEDCIIAVPGGYAKKLVS